MAAEAAKETKAEAVESAKKKCRRRRQTRVVTVVVETVEGVAGGQDATAREEIPRFVGCVERGSCIASSYRVKLMVVDEVSNPAVKKIAACATKITVSTNAPEEAHAMRTGNPEADGRRFGQRPVEVAREAADGAAQQEERRHVADEGRGRHEGHAAAPPVGEVAREVQSWYGIHKVLAASFYPQGCVSISIADSATIFWIDLDGISNTARVNSLV
ncbi:Protein of unknown function [Gryllus bimaculatus]|nr:Protein of unknown function [Gryllus bimaculatus]